MKSDHYRQSGLGVRLARPLRSIKPCGSGRRTSALFAALVVLACACPSPGWAATSSDPNKSPALCGAGDVPEPGIQGDLTKTPVNCGLSLLSRAPIGGSATGFDHCGYVRDPGILPYTGKDIYAYSLADPRNPVLTDQLTSVGGSESMRGRAFGKRAVLASGRGVYDISNCEKMVKKGEIPWPDASAQAGTYLQSTTSHEMAISHDSNRIYTGLGFAIAYIDDLEHPANWVVNVNSCQVGKQSGFAEYQVPVDLCKTAPNGVYIPALSHSSDDNAEGTRWYGANQCAATVNGPEDECPATARIVDISNPDSVTMLAKLPDFPGHSMNWWRDNHGKEFIIGANEIIPGGSPSDSCQAYPRPTSLGNSRDAYIVEVTGDKFGEKFPLTVAINRPENCAASKASGATAVVSEYSTFNKTYPDGHTVAFVMMEFAGPSAGGAGLRVFDVSDGYHPKEVAYYNDNTGYVHSAQFYYSEERGYIIASGTTGMQVLLLQPQVIKALELPAPTDPAYPYNSKASTKGGGGGAFGFGTLIPLLLLGLRRRQRH